MRTVAEHRKARGVLNDTPALIATDRAKRVAELERAQGEAQRVALENQIAKEELEVRLEELRLKREQLKQAGSQAKGPKKPLTPEEEASHRFRRIAREAQTQAELEVLLNEEVERIQTKVEAGSLSEVQALRILNNLRDDFAEKNEDD